MAWKQLTIDDVKLVLAQDEIQKLDGLSKDPDSFQVIENSIKMVSQAWRGAIKAKGAKVDIREYYVPETYMTWILVHLRHVLWTRFPQSTTIALDERRVAEYEQAMDFLANPPFDTDKVDPEYDPDKQIDGLKSTGSIFIPFQRIPPFGHHSDGFWYRINTGKYPPSELPNLSCNCR